jgi:hypothetical protein
LIEHYYRDGDHGPAHVHVTGEGPPTKIGANGHPFGDDPPMNARQRTVYLHHRARIRRAIKKIGRWLAYNEE